MTYNIPFTTNELKNAIIGGTFVASIFGLIIYMVYAFAIAPTYALLIGWGFPLLLTLPVLIPIGFVAYIASFLILGATGLALYGILLLPVLLIEHISR